VPTVVNETEVVKFWNNDIFKPGQEKEVEFFVPAETGLTVISEEPRVEPRCLASGEISVSQGASTEITIPSCDAFRASFVCLSGAAAIRQNYEDAQAVSIKPEYDYEIQYRRADVEKIIITGIVDAVIVYDIEKVK
jgi:hypothetical protein